ncbi:MAG: hypothetical protein FWB99_08335, partial [Treponema sp.]|nr:hypothetical protein [Treponema sp.]
RHNPVRIGLDNDWSYVSAGSTHTAAVRTDGTLWAWGSNWYGKIGDGTITRRDDNWNIIEDNTRYSPVRIGTATTWRSVSAGFRHTMAIRIDGTLWAWGNNEFGQIGDGTTTRRDPNSPWIIIEDNTRIAPVQVGTATNWASVNADWGQVVAIRTDGTLWVWGINESGILGDGTMTNRTSPVRIGTATNWASASVGRLWAREAGSWPWGYFIAVRTDGTLWAWGYNWYGNLGVGAGGTRIAPTRVMP